MMRIRSWAGILLLLAVSAPGIAAQDYGDNDEFQARVWLDRGDDPLLQRGDRVRIYYRTSADAYVAILHIDTDGTVRLLSPRTPDDDHFVRGGRDYRLLFPQSPYWFVDEAPGKGYFFVVASPDPFDFSAFAYTPYERGWDLSQVGQTVYEDPYVAIDEYVARLIPDWETEPYALDFLSYDVGEVHEYPRFLCYECHGYRAYTAWNPYTYACTNFRVVIWDDPYFYPTYRYRGTKVVFAQPRRGVARFEFKERATGESWKPLMRTRQPPMRSSVGYDEPAVAAPAMPEFAPPRRRVATPSDPLRGDTGAPARGAQPATGRSVVPDARGAEPAGASRRPSTPTPGAVPGRSVVPPPASRTPTRSATPAEPGATDPRAPGSRRPTTRVAPPSTTTPTSGERPVLQRRPTTTKPTGGGKQVVPSFRPPASGSPTAQPRSSGSSAGSPRSGKSAPAAQRPPSSGAKPPARPPAKVTKPGGGGSRSSAVRRPGGGG